MRRAEYLFRLFYMWFNGQRLPQTHLDRGLQFGDGHFTTLVIRAGQPEFWQRHWQRLVDASLRLHLELPSASDVLAVVAEIAQQTPNCVAKIIITRGFSERGYAPQLHSDCNWYVTTAPLAQWKQKPLQAELAYHQLARQPAWAGLKTLNRLDQVMLAYERQQRGVDELIVTDTEQQLVEATSSNLFWYDGEHWRMPRLDHAGVAGIMQAEICAQVLPKTVATTATWQDLLDAEQIFICNTVMGPRPIGQLGHKKLRQQGLPEAVKQWYLSVLSSSSPV